MLPAIKLHVNESVADQFKNPINLKKEIDRCFSGHALKIKFASLSRANLLIIATDDQTTHALLSSAWPADAFARGARPMDVKHNSKGTSKASAVLIIRHVHVCLDILDEETAKQLADQGVSMAKRITNRSGNPTTIVTAKPGPDANIKNLTPSSGTSTSADQRAQRARGRRAYDKIRLHMDTNKMEDYIKFDSVNLVMIIGGHNLVRTGSTFATRSVSNRNAARRQRCVQVDRRRT